MPVKFKYYLTDTPIYGDMLTEIRKLSHRPTHNQYAVVCKAKSMAEANRIAESYGLGGKIFQRDCTSIVGNELQIQEADKYGFIVNVDGTNGFNYIPIERIIKSHNEHKKE